MQGRVDWRGDEQDLVERAQAWREAGATHLAVNTMGAGLSGVDAHLDALASTARLLELA
jgi:hypothetical protein